MLRFVLEAKGYKLLKNKNIFMVAKDKDRKNTISNTHNILEKIVYIQELKNINVVTALKIIKTIMNGTRPKDSSNKTTVTSNQETNSIVLVGIKEEVNYLGSLLKQLDTPKTQVYVSAKIIEVNDQLVNNVGIKYGILAGNSNNGSLLTFASSLNAGNPFVFSPDKIGLSIPNIAQGLALGASISLLKQNYALNIVSEPSLLCLNNQESSIYVGETISVLTSSNSNANGTTNSYVREDVGLRLKITPRVMENNKVSLDIDTIIEGIKTLITTSGNADTSKKQIKTTAIVNNGESVIIGGLIEEKIESNINGIPFLQDIPFVGKLFQNTTYQKYQNNLVIIITPYIIPKSKDLSYMRQELTKLKLLENRLLDKYEPKKEE